MQIPQIGLGTRQILGESCSNIVTKALQNGYTHIDTAQIYKNEDAVGKGIADSKVNRNDFFLTTKVRASNFEHDKVISSTYDSLKRLGTDYVDLLLIHRPKKDFDHRQTLDAMMELQAKGAVKNIGVSNFPISELEIAVTHTGGKIYTNQVEFHVYLSQEKLLKYCSEKNIFLTAYSPLAQGKVLSDEVILDIAKKHGKTPSQIALKWLVQVHNSIVIPKTSNENRLLENLSIFDFMLDEEDIMKINFLPKNMRLLNPPFAPKWDE